jgi:hypothetical protein
MGATSAGGCTSTHTDSSPTLARAIATSTHMLCTCLQLVCCPTAAAFLQTSYAAALRQNSITFLVRHVRMLVAQEAAAGGAGLCHNLNQQVEHIDTGQLLQLLHLHPCSPLAATTAKVMQRKTKTVQSMLGLRTDPSKPHSATAGRRNTSSNRRKQYCRACVYAVLNGCRTCFF